MQIVKKLGLGSKSPRIDPTKEGFDPFKTVKQEILCDECSKFYASKYCPICDTNQCFECRALLHSVPRRKHHLETLLPLKLLEKPTETENKTNEKPNTFNCMIHQENKLSHFCVDCYKPTCSDCSSEGYHKTHNTLESTEAVKLLTEKIKSSQVTHLEDVERVKQELTELTQILEENYQKTGAQIKDFFKEMRTILDAHETKLSSDLLTVNQTSGRTLQKLIEKHQIMSQIPEKLAMDHSKMSFHEVWEIQKNLLEMENYKSEISQKDKICSSYDFQPDRTVLNQLLATRLEKGNPYVLKKKNPSNVDVNGTLISGDGIKGCYLQKETFFDVQFVDFEGKVLKIPQESLEVFITGPEKLIIVPKIKLVKGKFNVKYSCSRVGSVEIVLKLSSEMVRSLTIPCESTNVTYLTHEKPFDKNGLFTFLGTTKKKYENPSILRLVTVSCETLSSFGNKPFSLIGAECTNFYTDTKDPNQEVSVLISLEPSQYQLRPNYYSLRNALKVYDNALRNWKLEGFTDGNEWKLLKEHVNDESIETKSGFAFSWPLETDDFFSKFKLTSTGSQADEEDDKNITFGGIEFYGTLRKVK